MRVLVEVAAEDRFCQWEEGGVAGPLSMEAADGASFHEGNGPGQGAGVRGGLEKEEDWKRVLEQGGEDRVCQAEVAGVQKLGGNNTK